MEKNDANPQDSPLLPPRGAHLGAPDRGERHVHYVFSMPRSGREGSMNQRGCI